MSIRALKLFVLCFIIICVTMLGISGGSVSKAKSISSNTSKAESETFIANYKKWKEQSIRNGSDKYLILSIGWMKGVSTENTNAKGKVKIDLKDGSLSLRVKDLPEGEWAFWLIENHDGPGYSTLPDAGDGLLNAGSFSSNGKLAKLDSKIDTNILANFHIDRVVISRVGNTPMDFILTGAPNLFERLQLNHVEPTDIATQISTEELIEQGRNIFFNEKFNGNGRTCGTCHPEDNNFTIDPKYIASLPNNNPLFVAEFNSALSKNFEKPQLMRKFGLVLENVDGFDDLTHKFVLRSVSHLLALSTSITAPDPSFAVDFTTNGLNPNPTQRLGWGGDGAPGSGTLREFATGAVIQHFTKTLNRKAGSDFRLPTDAELNALEAFQLSLGRHEEINIRSLTLKNSLASNGRSLFLDTGHLAEPGHKNCNSCHFNAGAATGMGPGIDPTKLLDAFPAGFNSNQATAVNRLPGVAANGLPPDGAFGRLLLPDGAFGNFGDVPGVGLIPVQEFNAPPLIEAADTAPFFHNHLVTTLEQAVAFYGSDAFQNSPDSIGNLAAGGIVPVTISSNPNDPEVLAISAFLRVLNTLENVRSSVSLETRAQQTSDKRNLIKLAISENQDAINVLSNGALVSQLGSPSVGTAYANLIVADTLLKTAAGLPSSQNSTINALLSSAVQRQREARIALVDPNTLPVSFRN